MIEQDNSHNLDYNDLVKYWFPVIFLSGYDNIFLPDDGSTRYPYVFNGKIDARLLGFKTHKNDC